MKRFLLTWSSYVSIISSKVSSSEHHHCFIKTSSLDGEKTLKKKKCPGVQNYIMPDESISMIIGECVAEKPNPDLYSFLGKLKVSDTEVPLNISHFIPKGCQLKNTSWVYGLVVYSGKQTKIMLNSIKGKRKQSNLERKLNNLIVLILVLQVCLCIILGVLSSTVYKTE